MYLLNEELTLTLTSGYSVIQRNAIIREWQAHRRGGMTPTVQQPAELTRKDLLLMALKAEEEKELLQRNYDLLGTELSQAIREKAHIGSSREASVMGKLARANDKIREYEARFAIDVNEKLNLAQIAHKLNVETDVLSVIIATLGIYGLKNFGEKQIIYKRGGQQEEEWRYNAASFELIKKALKEQQKNERKN
jgi:hypothetical protein